jgi:dTMP kinase
MNQGHPRFISLEGIDGSGKSTQIALLINHLKSFGLDAIQVREPGGTRVSDEIRRLLLSPENLIAPAAELLLYSAARAQLVSQVISPALEAGKVVIADRFGWSTLAYQGFGRGLDQNQIQQLFQVACGSIWPSHTLLLDLPIVTMRSRLAAGGRPADRMENENEAFFERVRQGYLTIAKENPEKFTVLDASQPLEFLHATILKHFEEWIPELRLVRPV